MKELRSKGELRRMLGGTVLAVAATGVSAAKPLWAGGYSHAPGNVGSYGGYYPVASPYTEDLESRIGRLFERIRKEPFDHYAHNPDDLRRRPICPPYCPPCFGYAEPRWRQLPCPDEPAYAAYAPAVPQHTVPPPAPAKLPPAPPASPPRELPADMNDFPPVAPPRDESLSQVPDINPGPSLWRPSDGWTAHQPES